MSFNVKAETLNELKENFPHQVISNYHYNVWLLSPLWLLCIKAVTWVKYNKNSKDQ